MSTIKILASKASMDSAMKFRDALIDTINVGLKKAKQPLLKEKAFLVTDDTGTCRGKTVLLRYGCAYGTLEKEPRWGNKNFSAICINKLLTADLLGKYCKVPTFHGGGYPEAYPVIIRQTLTGSQSEGLVVVKNREEFRSAWRDGYYWTPFIEHNAEIRVNVAFLKEGAKVRIYKKVPRTENGEDVFIAGRNGEDNTHWVLKDAEDYPKVFVILNKIAPAIMKAGGVFVGIDMIYSPKQKNYVVLEMNSGPWLTQSTAKWLAEIFIQDTKKSLY